MGTSGKEGGRGEAHVERLCLWGLEGRAQELVHSGSDRAGLS